MDSLVGQLRECPACGLIQAMPALAPRTVARCERCETLLQRHRADPIRRSLALAITALLMWLVATQMPFLEVSMRGIERRTTLLSGPIELEQLGMWPLAVVVVLTTIAAPLVRLLCMIVVLVGLQAARPPAWLHAAFRWVERLRPWSMVEVFLLGVFVAYTKMIDIAEIDVGAAIYALGGLMLAGAAADAALDPDVVWATLERQHCTAQPLPTPPDASRLRAVGAARMVGCDCCGLVSEAAPHCPRCGSDLHRRKPDAVSRTWALLAAAAVLYIPANILPVMRVVSLGRGEDDTILSGVDSLAAAGMWPLALLVFFASITVPVLKLLGLGLMLVTTQRGSAWRLRERTLLYRIVDGIGRWSMIDVFMISILTALVRMGELASVYPRPGVLAFCAVVILTMFAAMSFDPRRMWDAASAPRVPRKGRGVRRSRADPATTVRAAE